MIGRLIMCGIIGILGSDPILEPLCQGMIQLQHRGQDASGVFLSDPFIETTFLRKKLGWVHQLFQEAEFPPLLRWGLGHIRYSTSGKGLIEDAQPLAIKKGGRTLAIAHNGNIINYTQLRTELENEGIDFQTHCDSESILHILAKNLPMTGPFFENLCNAIKTVFLRVNGSYSVIGIASRLGIFAFRDPKGIRPLLYGKNDRLFAFASESLALTQIGCKEIQDIAPGEVVYRDAEGQIQRKVLSRQKHSHCAFEFNYFARTPTILEGKEVYSVRVELGRRLAEKIHKLNPFPIDVVIPVPDTGNPAGISLSRFLQIPYAEGFSRQQQAGRTFITAGSGKRQAAAVQKLSPVRSVFEGKNVLLVDDSIVRGTVSKRTIALAKAAGANKILFASTFPPVAYPCVYGIDFPCREQLIAANKSLAEIAEEIGADAVVYTEEEDLKHAIGLNDLCLGCITGRYPTSTKEIKTLQLLREQDLNTEVAVK